MPSGINNKEKAKVRELFALGQVTRDQLLEAEAASYHTAGTCTFYGTANSNQMMMELMGLHLPGTAFVNPGTPLREALVRAAAQRCIELAQSGESIMAHVVDAKSIVNAIVGLMATGGSTNHALHIPAMAHAAGIIVDWDDFSDISGVTPLLARVYPNGSADVNNFRTAQAIQAVRGTASPRNERRPFHTPEGSLCDVSPSTPQDRTASDDADVIHSRNAR